MPSSRYGTPKAGSGGEPTWTVRIRTKVSTPRRSAARVTTIAVAREASGYARLRPCNSHQRRTDKNNASTGVLFRTRSASAELAASRTSNPATRRRSAADERRSAFFHNQDHRFFCNQDGGRRRAKRSKHRGSRKISLVYGSSFIITCVVIEGTFQRSIMHKYRTAIAER